MEKLLKNNTFEGNKLQWENNDTGSGMVNYSDEIAENYVKLQEVEIES